MAESSNYAMSGVSSCSASCCSCCCCILLILIFIGYQFVEGNI